MFGRFTQWLHERDTPDNRTTVSAVIVNLIPVVGTVAFGWSLVNLVFIYLVELTVMALVYSTIALFTTQPVEETQLSRVMGYDDEASLDADRWEGDATPIRLTARLPPVYVRNIQFVTRTLVIFPVLAGVGYTLFEQLLGQYPAVTPTLGVATLGVCAGQIGHAWRHWIADSAYTDHSPAAIIAASHELFGLYALVLVVVVPSVTVVVIALALGGVATRALLLPYLVPIALAKTYFE